MSAVVRNSRHRVIIVLVIAVGMGAVIWGQDPARIELHALQTMTLSDEQFLTGSKEGTPATISAALRLPRASSERLPAVVIMHGSGGIAATEDRWSRELNKIGVATLTVDSFTGRGIIFTAADQPQLGNLTTIIDAYRALELLANNRFIDRERIGIMGFSRGGRAALYASLKRFQRLHGPGGLEFAAYLPFYAPCYTQYVDDEVVSDRPIRLFHGSADDYAPVAPCRAYVERLRRVGKDAQLTEYAAASHSFDNPLSTLRKSNFQTARRCTLEERPLGRIVESRSGSPFSWEHSCVERGVTVGYNVKAHGEAVKAVGALLKGVLSLFSGSV